MTQYEYSFVVYNVKYYSEIISTCLVNRSDIRHLVRYFVKLMFIS